MGSNSRWVVIAVATAASLFICETTASAQAADNSNQGALHFTGGIDQASVYVFRGFVQEQDPKLTVFPYGDLAIALTSGEGFVRSTVVNVGVWNSLNTGSSGTDGPSGHLHYEEEFYARLNWLFKGGIAVGAGYMARTSPNNMFDTQKEFQLKIAKDRQAESLRVSRVRADAERTGRRRHSEGHISRTGRCAELRRGWKSAARDSGKGGFQSE